MRLMPLPRALVLLFAMCIFPACGGGGGDSGGTTGGGAGGGGGGGAPGASMTAAELQLGMDALAAINTHRATETLPPLTWYAPGADAAYGHCVAMETEGFWAHVNPTTNSTPATRSIAAGITHDPQGALDPTSGQPFVGENLATATGFPTVTYTGQQAVDAWLASPGHHAQIDAPNLVPGGTVMPAWTHCVIGVRVTDQQIWYTAMFWRNPTP